MPRTRVKFCGMMRPADAVAAADAGADAVGMILHADARRKIDAGTAAAIVAALPPYVAAVGLFVDAPADAIFGTAAGLRLSSVQLHGDETPADVAQLRPIKVVKVLRVDGKLDDNLATWREAVALGEVPNLTAILLDGPGGGGTGVANDFERIATMQNAGAFDGLPPIVIAGGLTPENAGPVVAALRPYAVDASSGIEAAFGEKSPDKMRAFVSAVRTATDR